MESHQPPKRPSLHLLTDEGGAASGSGAGAGAGSVGGAIAEMSPTSGFLPDMPQWKKDLIQRRKTNVARTQAASIASPTEGGGSCGALAEVPVPGASNADAAPGSTSQALAKRNANANATLVAEEKSEKSLTGGHHTQGKDFVVAAISNEVAPALAATTTTTTTTTTLAPIPKQRSSLLNTQRSQEQPPEILNSELRERGGEPAAVGSMVGLSMRSHIRGEVESGTAAAETTGALTETALAAATSSSSSSSANQLLTKCKPGQSVAEGSLFPEASQLDNKSSSSSCKTKSISDKLQSNKFIQQQQQQYHHQQQQQVSPSKVTVKPTMVAMQEMKKTTKQNGQHRHIPGKISTGSGGGAGDPDGSPSNLQDSLVDTNEDLSYGPGIVSKLRCRYLSLALRESRQQNSKQRLQRSTSLNTLLDRDDDEGDGETEMPEDGPTVVAISQVRAKSTPPPILGAKPTPKPIQRPVSLGANGTVPTAAINPPSVAANCEDTKPGGGVTNGGGANGGVNRSRHFKRGNEVMKRARSVEALLCEKSPWNSQRSSNMTPGSNAPAAKTLTATSPAASPTCVTIEDKIHNARERLHSGTDTAPPKRLASIIDDTERPPPDLVKQTLKMFEASANRRPRTAHRSNGVGGVASKVASYKSIIKEQKVAPPSVGFASSTPLRPVNHPDIIPRQAETSMSTLSMMMRRIDLPETEQPAEEQLVAIGGTQPNEAPSETEPRDEGDGDEGGDRGDVAGEGDDDNNEKHDNDNEGNGDGGNDDDGDGDGDGDVENNDKMGAAGDKLSPKSPATEAGGAQHRSFAPSTENVHVAAPVQVAAGSGGVTPVRKLNTESSSSSTSTTKQIGVIRPLFNSQGITPPLTSREIEKNRINEMKKSSEAGGIGSGGGGTTGSLASPTTSLDTVINTKEPTAATGSSHSETDATASPLWTLRKTGQRPGQNQGAGGVGVGVGVTASSSHTATENTSMVFNFSKSTNKVPDYIESDVVIYRRKRELPKPNEPGFVLLGDLSVETSTDTDYDDLSMCPPSPCDVEFENANIVIDGKSSIRQKPKESTFRVQFNDTLTSTFEYPSEASMTIDDPPYADPFGHVSKHHQMLLAEQMQLLQHQQQLDLEQQQHHHVTVDEIIELPTSTAGQGHGHGHGTHSNNKQQAAAGATGGGTMLGNLPLGSKALGFYTPMKGGTPMDSLFQLGITRYALPESSSSGSNSSSNGSSPAGANANRAMFNGNGSLVGLGEGLIKDHEPNSTPAGGGGGGGAEASNGGDGAAVDEDDYHLTATPGGGVVYSEGTQKTDLLY